MGSLEGQLKAYRSEQASAKGMPAYCIFSNAVLEAIAAAAVSAHALRRCV